MNDEPFDLEGLPEPLPRKALRPSQSADGKVTWSAYKPVDPVHCDVCVRQVHEQWARGGTHAPNRAVFRRREGQEITFWCANHGTEQKARDEDAKPKREKASKRR